LASEREPLIATLLISASADAAFADGTGSADYFTGHCKADST
jgi:hypothetical protein